ncbi:hypothetical protein [Maribacter sp. MAR_2009_72]|uniref:hypothetical protein n=1 Tax=Maribacter sp. MAR_2009_72 TaxID=1250050 RepID=UPI00119C1FCD|nr:hypothetical protein [Maribacter sp. MAR_2009_72]TVZ17193.1 hypothetical protein JM81_3471 [Maribacter sp. MAR_2009_72]
MRKLSLVVVAAVLFATGNVMANDNTDIGPAKSLSSQISVMLANNNFSEIDFDLTAQVRFTLNSEGEIVVLSVDSQYERMERFVKNSLNYKKVDLSKVEEGKIYTIPVRIKA